MHGDTHAWIWAEADRASAAHLLQRAGGLPDKCVFPREAIRHAVSVVQAMASDSIAALVTKMHADLDGCISEEDFLFRIIARLRAPKFIDVIPRLSRTVAAEILNSPAVMTSQGYMVERLDETILAEILCACGCPISAATLLSTMHPSKVRRVLNHYRGLKFPFPAEDIEKERAWMVEPDDEHANDESDATSDESFAVQPVVDPFNRGTVALASHSALQHVKSLLRDNRPPTLDDIRRIFDICSLPDRHLLLHIYVDALLPVCRELRSQSPNKFRSPINFVLMRDHEIVDRFVAKHGSTSAGRMVVTGAEDLRLELQDESSERHQLTSVRQQRRTLALGRRVKRTSTTRRTRASGGATRPADEQATQEVRATSEPAPLSPFSQILAAVAAPLTPPSPYTASFRAIFSESSD